MVALVRHAVAMGSQAITRCYLRLSGAAWHTQPVARARVSEPQTSYLKTRAHHYIPDEGLASTDDEFPATNDSEEQGGYY